MAESRICFKSWTIDDYIRNRLAENRLTEITNNINLWFLQHSSIKVLNFGAEEHHGADYCHHCGYYAWVLYENNDCY